MRYIILLQGIQLITREKLDSLQEVSLELNQISFHQWSSLGEKVICDYRLDNGIRIRKFTSSSGSRLDQHSWCKEGKIVYVKTNYHGTLTEDLPIGGQHFNIDSHTLAVRGSQETEFQTRSDWSRKSLLHSLYLNRNAAITVSDGGYQKLDGRTWASYHSNQPLPLVSSSRMALDVIQSTGLRVYLFNINIIQSRQCKRTGTSWAKQVIKKLWNFLYQAWAERNCLLHTT